MDLQAMDWSTRTQRRASKAPPEDGGWNVFSTHAIATFIANPLTHDARRNCESAWCAWPCAPLIVALTQQWALACDPAKREEILHGLQALHLENVSYIPLGRHQPAIILRKEMKDVIPGPAIFYRNLKKES